MQISGPVRQRHNGNKRITAGRKAKKEMDRKAEPRVSC